MVLSYPAQTVFRVRRNLVPPGDQEYQSQLIQRGQNLLSFAVHILNARFPFIWVRSFQKERLRDGFVVIAMAFPLFVREPRAETRALDSLFSAEHENDSIARRFCSVFEKREDIELYLS